jgi:hypothetical protein
MYGYLARLSRGSRLNRLLLDLAWLIIQFAIIVAGWVGGALAGYWLSLHVFPSGSANAWIEGGFCVGVGVALAVNHYARGWGRRLRLALLRGWGAGVDGEAGFLDSTRTVAVRGMSHIFYTAGVTWTDPATGVRWRGERRYHFTQSSFRDLSLEPRPPALGALVRPPVITAGPQRDRPPGARGEGRSSAEPGW